MAALVLEDSRRRRWARGLIERGSGNQWVVQTRQIHQNRPRHRAPRKDSSLLLSTKPPLLSILQTNPELQDVEEATIELNWIITETRAGITRGKEAELDEDDVEREIEDRVRRRGRGEPIQYILGKLLSIRIRPLGPTSKTLMR